MVEKARQAVESRGGTFVGDIHSGSFHISFLGNSAAGSYKAVKNELQIEISEKPMFVSCSMIEGFLKKQLEG